VLDCRACVAAAAATGAFALPYVVRYHKALLLLLPLLLMDAPLPSSADKARRVAAHAAARAVAWPTIDAGDADTPPDSSRGRSPVVVVLFRFVSGDDAGRRGAECKGNAVRYSLTGRGSVGGGCAGCGGA
jgi:hypothetical protein